MTRCPLCGGVVQPLPKPNPPSFCDWGDEPCTHACLDCGMHFEQT